MRKQIDHEVDRIVAREKPGYTRVAGRPRPPAKRTSRPDSGTPDVAALHAAATALRLWDFEPPAARTLPASSTTPRRRGGPATGRRAASKSPTHHIVTVAHGRVDEALPLQTRVLVISRSRRRIIGEQG